MKLTHKLFLSYISIIIVLAMGGGIIFYNLQSAKNQFENLVTQSLPVSSALNDITQGTLIVFAEILELPDNNSAMFPIPEDVNRHIKKGTDLYARGIVAYKNAVETHFQNERQMYDVIEEHLAQLTQKTSKIIEEASSMQPILHIPLFLRFTTDLI